MRCGLQVFLEDIPYRSVLCLEQHLRRTHISRWIDRRQVKSCPSPTGEFNQLIPFRIPDLLERSVGLRRPEVQMGSSVFRPEAIPRPIFFPPAFESFGFPEFHGACQRTSSMKRVRVDYSDRCICWIVDAHVTTTMTALGRWWPSRDEYHIASGAA